MLAGWNKKRDNSLFFEPGRNGVQLIAHQSDVMNVADGAFIVNVPDGCNCVLAQAINQNVNYTLTPASPPTATSGFVLIAGNDPLIIPCRIETSVLIFHAAVNGARLELQFGQV